MKISIKMNIEADANSLPALADDMRELLHCCRWGDDDIEFIDIETVHIWKTNAGISAEIVATTNKNLRQDEMDGLCEDLGYQLHAIADSFTDLVDADVRVVPA